MLTVLILQNCEANPQASPFSIKWNGWGNADQNEDNALAGNDDSAESVWGIFGFDNNNSDEDNEQNLNTFPNSGQSNEVSVNTENILIIDVQDIESDANHNGQNTISNVQFDNSHNLTTTDSLQNLLNFNGDELEDNEEESSDDGMVVARRAHYGFHRLCRRGCLSKRLCSGGNCRSQCIKKRFKFLSTRTILRYKNRALC